MRGLSTAFWSVVLIGSTASIAAGFVGGRSIGAAGSLPAPVRAPDTADLPAPIRQHVLVRQLVGDHSLDAAEAVDPYGDPSLAVADYPRAKPSFDPRSERAKIAVIVIDAGRAGEAIDPFVHSSLPVNLVVAPGDPNVRETIGAIRNAGKLAIIDASEARPRDVASLAADGALPILASAGEQRARALMHAVGRGSLVVDAQLSEDDAVSDVARATAHRALVRDVIADARDDAKYVDFMLRDALALAQRQGRAIVVIHARTESFDALARFADRAERDGADLVTLSDLTS